MPAGNAPPQLRGNDKQRNEILMKWGIRAQRCRRSVFKLPAAPPADLLFFIFYLFLFSFFFVRRARVSVAKAFFMCGCREHVIESSTRYNLLCRDGRKLYTRSR